MIISSTSGTTILAQEIEIVNENGPIDWIPVLVLDSVRMNPEKGIEILSRHLFDWGLFNHEITKPTQYQFMVDAGCSFGMNIRIFEDGTEIHPIELYFYSRKEIEDEINRRLFRLVDEGYYYSEASITEFEIQSDSCFVNIRVDIKKNGLVYIDDLQFEGNRLNSDRYLKRVSIFKDSLIASPENINQFRFNLEQSELFENVGEPVISSRENTHFGVIQVEERALNQFDGLLGYVPNSNGEGQVVGDLNLNLWNVFADGNGLNVEYRRLQPEISRLNIGVRQFWLGNIPVGLNAGFRFFQNDTTYQARNLGFGGDYLIGNGLRLIGSVEFEAVTGSQQGLTIEPGGSKQSGSFGFRYSSLSGGEVPRTGIKGEIQFGISNKTFDIDSLEGASQQFIWSELEGYLSTGRQSVIASRISGFLLNADQITDIDLSRFGGANSFRGYSEEQFAASQLIWGDLEYRYLTNSTSYLFLFGAAGWYHRPKLLTEENNQFKQSEFLNAFGFGLSYKVRIGRLKFTYAISPTEVLGNGKVHVGITTSL